MWEKVYITDRYSNNKAKIRRKLGVTKSYKVVCTKGSTDRKDEKILKDMVWLRYLHCDVKLFANVLADSISTELY